MAEVPHREACLHRRAAGRIAMEWSDEVGWVCEFCGAAFIDPEECAEHEVKCDKNPEG